MGVGSCRSFGCHCGDCVGVAGGTIARQVAAEMRLEITTPPTTDPVSFEISPDGRQFVFVATFEGRPRLWLRRLDTGSSRALPGTDYAAFPFWSPDGQSIGFFANQRLERIDLDGNRVQALARVEVGLGGTWTRDGVILFGSPLAIRSVVSERPAARPCR